MLISFEGVETAVSSDFWNPSVILQGKMSQNIMFSLSDNKKLIIL